MSTYPNPLNINFGLGRIAVFRFNDDKGRGIVLREVKSSMHIGESCGIPDDPKHIPQEGEVYLHFQNLQSAQIVRDEIERVIDDWPNPAVDKLAKISALCDTHADGAPDAHPRDKLANEILGIITP